MTRTPGASPLIESPHAAATPGPGHRDPGPAGHHRHRVHHRTRTGASSPPCRTRLPAGEARRSPTSWPPRSPVPLPRLGRPRRQAEAYNYFTNGAILAWRVDIFDEAANNNGEVPSSGAVHEQTLPKIPQAAVTEPWQLFLGNSSRGHYLENWVNIERFGADLGDFYGVDDQGNVTSGPRRPGPAPTSCRTPRRGSATSSRCSASTSPYKTGPGPTGGRRRGRALRAARPRSPQHPRVHRLRGGATPSPA